MRISTPSNKYRKHQDGLAVVIILILIAIVLGFILENASTLSALHNDVKRIEQRQIRRINPPPASTNSPAAQAAK